MRYTIDDKDGISLISAKLEPETFGDTTDNIIKITADKEQWITPEDAEDFAQALMRLATRAKTELQIRALEATMGKAFEKASKKRPAGDLQ